MKSMSFSTLSDCSDRPILWKTLAISTSRPVTIVFANARSSPVTVSYTHLDVYKRQH